MRRAVALMGTVVLAVGAGLAAVSPAAAAPVVSAAGTSVLVEIGPPMGPGPDRRTEPVTAWLRCGPWAVNEHPFQTQACAELTLVRGRVEAIPPLPGYKCLSYLQPVEISVTGVVGGVPVRFTDVATNEGCANISHGHVFRLL